MPFVASDDQETPARSLLLPSGFFVQLNFDLYLVFDFANYYPQSQIIFGESMSIHKNSIWAEG